MTAGIAGVPSVLGNGKGLIFHAQERNHGGLGVFVLGLVTIIKI